MHSSTKVFIGFIEEILDYFSIICDWSLFDRDRDAVEHEALFEAALIAGRHPGKERFPIRLGDAAFFRASEETFFRHGGYIVEHLSHGITFLAAHIRGGGKLQPT